MDFAANGAMFWDLNVAWDPKRAAASADLALRWGGFFMFLLEGLTESLQILNMILGVRFGFAGRETSLGQRGPSFCATDCKTHLFFFTSFPESFLRFTGLFDVS